MESLEPYGGIEGDSNVPHRKHSPMSVRSQGSEHKIAGQPLESCQATSQQPLTSRKFYPYQPDGHEGKGGRCELLFSPRYDGEIDKGGAVFLHW